MLRRGTAVWFRVRAEIEAPQERAKKGQYRTEGTRFCTDSCAQAQVQREARRRRARNQTGPLEPAHKRKQR